MKKIDIIQLVGIYIILTSLSYAFYIVFVAVGANEEIASSLLSWTSTMFATIALLYTFNSWREQKGSEVIANEAKDLIKDITQNISILGDIIYEYSNLTIKNENVISNLLNCKKLELEIHRKIYFIENTIVFYDLDKLYKDFDYKNSSIIDNLEFRINKNDFKEYERYRPLLIEKYIALCKLSDDLIKKLSIYSLYQRPIKFKNNKSA